MSLYRCYICTLDISDLVDVQESVKEIVSDWKTLGLHLGLLWHTLKSIEEEQHGHVEKCRMEMLAVWLQGKDNAKEQTWSTLVDAVGRINGALSERIRCDRM